MISRTIRLRCLPAPAATSCALQEFKLPNFHLVRNADSEIVPGSVRCDADSTLHSASPRACLLGSTRALLAGVFWKREGGVQRSGGLLCRSFYAESLSNERSERNGNSESGTLPEGSSRSGSAAVRPLQGSHLQPSLVADDFRSLIVSKKREIAVLEAALEILETAPRDKRIEDLVRKHNIQLEPSKLSISLQERRRESPEPLLLKTDSPEVMLGDHVDKSNIELEPASPVEPSSQVIDSSIVTLLKNDFVDLEPDSQDDTRRNTSKPPSQETNSSTLFGKLSLEDFPSPLDPNLERLQKKRRRLELMREYERNSKNESLNFGVAGKNAVGGSNPSEGSPVDPLRPNASAFVEQPEKKPYKSLADRLYEEHFGRPAPVGLKRTYPKGSFYDRCMKAKEKKERDAAGAAQVASPSPPKSVFSPNESDVSVSSQRDETNDNVFRRNIGSNDLNQARKPGAWKCPECTFFNLATDKYCYRCQAQRGETDRGDGRDSGENARRDGRDSGRQSSREREKGG